MPEIILHHYPQSPVSEKVRVILGMKGLDWHSVIIPRLPPKPELTPLTGGYRLTPVMQVGADIYCDSLCIMRELERRYPEPTLFPNGFGELGWGVSRWTDGPFFKSAIALFFADTGDCMPADFAKDRGQLYFGPEYDVEKIKATLRKTLSDLRAQFGWMESTLADGRAFMHGSRPGLLDALCYYLAWFVRGRYSEGPEFLAQFEKLCPWETRVRDIGHGKSVAMSAADAVGMAHGSEPAAAGVTNLELVGGMKPGDEIGIIPDLGGPTVTGRIASIDPQEVVIRRQDERVGEVAVHFPQIGYQVVPS